MKNRKSQSIQRRDFLKLAAVGAGALLTGSCGCLKNELSSARRRPLDGKLILTLNSCIRVNQIEATRTRNLGIDEYGRHTAKNIKALRQALTDGWPEARMTWAMSWQALHDQRDNYREARRLVRQFHDTYNDDVTFIPGGFFCQYVQHA